MKNLLWELLARIVSHPTIADWLIQRAKRTPYFHIYSADGEHLYMGRWWLFNPYERDAEDNQGAARFTWLPSIRIHHICREDHDRHLHNHPWDARTIILKGGYMEELPGHQMRFRAAGDTGTIKHQDYHRIATITPYGVWTLFFTWGYQGPWGFDADGEFVHWKTYLNEHDQPVPSQGKPATFIGFDHGASDGTSVAALAISDDVPPALRGARVIEIEQWSKRP